jgi:hypothetical protein
MSLFDLVAMLLTISAAFAFLNAKFVRLPTEVGVLVIGLVTSLLLIGVELLTAETEHARDFTAAVRQIDFQASLMNGMLAFMLFAGALHVDLVKLRSRALTVALLATVGVLISTVVVGTALWLVAGWLGTPIPLAWALVFGALISPTDPVAVLSTLKSVRVPEELQVEMSGEALLNDGVGVVLFTILLSAAAEPQTEGFDLGQAIRESRRSRLTPALSLESPPSSDGTSKRAINCSEFHVAPAKSSSISWENATGNSEDGASPGSWCLRQSSSPERREHQNWRWAATTELSLSKSIGVNNVGCDRSGAFSPIVKKNEISRLAPATMRAVGSVIRRRRTPARSTPASSDGSCQINRGGYGPVYPHSPKSKCRQYRSDSPNTERFDTAWVDRTQVRRAESLGGRFQPPSQLPYCSR